MRTNTNRIGMALALTFLLTSSGCFEEPQPLGSDCDRSVGVGQSAECRSKSTQNPPSGLSYSTSNLNASLGVAITALAPTVTGSVDSYSVNPALPSGLSLDTSTGVISGTPSSASASAVYTVTATNAYGSTTTQIAITVSLPPAPSGLSYQNGKFFRGYAITPLTPTVTGDVASYSVSPSLPAGLSLDTTTGVISGTPTAAQTGQTYTITSTNVGGSAQTDITIEVRQFVAAAVGSWQSCFLINRGANSDNGIACTGKNDAGSLGNDSATGNTSSPVWTTLGLGSSISKIRSTVTHTCALKSNGIVYCWGRGVFGQLGQGDYSNKDVPTMVLLEGGVQATSIAVGASHSCAVDSNQKVQCWGDNYYGQIGSGETDELDFFDFTWPIIVQADGGGDLSGVSDVSAGYAHTCAVKSNGSVWCWGDNHYGQLGVSSGVINSVASDFCAGRYDCASVVARSVEDVGGGGTLGSIAKIFSGYEFQLALTSAGALLGWGDNSMGMLGNSDNPLNCIVMGGAGSCMSVTPVANLSAAGTPRTNVTSAFTGQIHACATLTTGGMKCWGLGGSLGTGSPGESSVYGVDPIGMTSGLSGEVTGNSGTSSCAIKDGVAYCWGSCGSGECGTGASGTQAPTPVDVSLLD